MSTQSEGTVSPNTDRPRPVNNIFIFYNWDLKVSGKFSFTIDDCVSGTCANGELCVDDVNSYSCNCSAGYTVERCLSSIVGGKFCHQQKQQQQQTYFCGVYNY